MNKARNTSEIGEIEEEQQEEKEVTNVVNLQVVGGREPPEDGDWLSNLEEGAVFLVRNKKHLLDFNLGLFKLEGKFSKNAVVLRTPVVPHAMYVVPTLFCKEYSLHESLGTVGYLEDKQEEPEQEVSDNADSNRS